ncbi:competence/damage-inducible protein A [Lutispora thermophila]|uniref:Putative competence-damage inducible protein n=1 Tax=Lutispora thermophila DSM 19022 TaxID=1122184 RepID=A0A1M6I601_9FIRM|nr:competence/damage-inducible protein A [Lutispora thermophila]SHJ29877.1 nicotinamide-nucleotide amidase [Lutispora thermophila DSM 19022]
MNCEIISVGTELLLGDIVNTNAQYLSKRLSDLGIDVYNQTVVGDNLNRLVESLSIASNRADIIITTGGLGPTDDDLTKLGIAKALGVEMILDESSLKKIKGYFNKLNKTMPIINERQAYIPLGSQAVENNNGTAPGIIGEYGKNIYIALPGPPKEMKLMFEESIVPYLRQKSKSNIKSRTIKVIGIGESMIQEKLGDMMINQKNPTVALYAKEGEVHIRITAKEEDIEKADYKIKEVENVILGMFSEDIYGFDGDTLESVVNGLLQKKNKTIAFAESCTGGMISSRYTDIPNASISFLNGVVCYSNEAKINILGVNRETIEKHGAVSMETAEEMAVGIKRISKSDIGISITGIAGPSGGTESKPVGLCYIGLAMDNEVKVYSYIFNGNRAKIRWLASTKALDILRRAILALKE